MTDTDTFAKTLKISLQKDANVLIAYLAKTALII